MTRHRARTLLLVLCVWPALMACAEEARWIRVGVTTKGEVVERYGEPDRVLVSTHGETLTYRPLPSRPPTVSIPVARAGPGGLGIFQTESIVPGLGVRDIAAGTHPRPHGEIHIEFNDQGIVREVRDR